MSRKGENIYKRKDGRWEGRYLKHIPGEKSRYGYVYAPTYREARAKLHMAAAAWAQLQPRSESPLFREQAEKWQKHIFQQVKESTFVKYSTMVRKHLLPILGDLPLDELTHIKIQALSDQLLATLSPRSVSDALSVLRSVLRFAKLEGHNILCYGSEIRIRCAPTQIRVLSPGEQNALCEYLLADLTPRNAGVLLSLFTGLRIGEVCALRWEDISIHDRVLHVRRTMQRLQNLSPAGARTRIVITEPKSAHSVRTIPLTEDLVRFLYSVPGPKNGYFLTGSEDAFVEPRTMQYHFVKVTADSGIPQVNFHVLRHTFATRCVELGCDTKSLSELLGHSTVTMTLDRYVHPTLEHKRHSMDKLVPYLTAQMTAKTRKHQNFLSS